MEDEKEEKAENKKRNYKSPQLIVYGDIAEITRSNVSNNMNDKGAGSFSMT